MMRIRPYVCHARSPDGRPSLRNLSILKHELLRLIEVLRARSAHSREQRVKHTFHEFYA